MKKEWNIIYLPETAQQFAEFTNIIWLKGEKKFKQSELQKYKK